MARIGIQSRKLFSIPHLASFFPDDTLTHIPWLRPDTTQLDMLAGWGHKRYGRLTRAWAHRRNLFYLALEDGFVRSYDLAVRGAPPCSLVMDTQGIYYDARQPSSLEALITNAAQSAPTERAETLMQRIRSSCISKYNCAPFENATITSIKQPYVLLIDQCAGDASVPMGYAGTESFARMIQDAAAEYPDHQWIIKTHPDVVSGAKKGYLASQSLPSRCVLLHEEINPYSLLQDASALFVATSLVGMEGLIAGKRVITYGAPFYAGWGLTDDRALPPTVAARRTARPGLAQLFDAAYLQYTRYIDPVTGTASDLERTIEHIEALRTYYGAWPRKVHAYGFSRWKRPHITPFLAPPGGQVIYHDSLPDATQAARKEQTPLAIWAAKEAYESIPTDIQVLRLEDGFIRSRGLGSDLLPANSLVCDNIGIYFDATHPSTLEEILEKTEFSEELLKRGAALRERIVSEHISKYNVGTDVLPNLPTNREIHLVIGQVEDDASIARGSTGIKTNDALLEAARTAYPDAWLLYKPHPDVLAGNRRKGAADKTPLRFANQIVTSTALPLLLPKVARLHTITSLAGFEMLLRGGHVTTYGRPFYAGWGLTEDKDGTIPRRNRTLTVEALVSAALILYPRYYDWNIHLPISPEQCLDLLSGQAAPEVHARQCKRLLRWLRIRK